MMDVKAQIQIEISDPETLGLIGHALSLIHRADAEANALNKIAETDEMARILYGAVPKPTRQEVAEARKRLARRRAPKSARR